MLFGLLTTVLAAAGGVLVLMHDYSLRHAEAHQRSSEHQARVLRLERMAANLSDRGFSPAGTRFDHAGWRNDTVRPSGNRVLQIPIDVPDPAMPREPLVGSATRKGR